MLRSDIINHLIEKNDYKKYLEIGVRTPQQNINLIKIDHKDGVDPAGNCNYPMESDVFFEQIGKDVKYDIIFIDGLHLDYQVDRDISNSFKHLSEGGVIVMHDCNPPTKQHQIEHYDGHSPWNGTVWKSYVKLRMSDENIHMYVVDTDWGVGILKRGKQELFEYRDNLTFEFLDDNREKLLNLIPKEKFKKYDSSI